MAVTALAAAAAAAATGPRWATTQGGTSPLARGAVAATTPMLGWTAAGELNQYALAMLSTPPSCCFNSEPPTSLSIANRALSHSHTLACPA